MQIKEKSDRLAEIAQNLTSSYENVGSINNLDRANLPSQQKIIKICGVFLSLLFPGFIHDEKIHSEQHQEWVEDKLQWLHAALATEIRHSMKFSNPERCSDDCRHFSSDLALKILGELAEVRAVLATDVEAAFMGDPAATTKEEIILCYPSLFAVSLYRVAHVICKLDIPLIPRMMTEYAHRETGIDIHPGASIGPYFFIDHGTGVVIGGTAIIGSNVKIYQNVTLGALSFKKDGDGKLIKNIKRHPTIKDHVVVYSGSTILGGETVVGERSVIGGNVWLTESIPAGTVILFDSKSQNLKIFSKTA